MNDESLANSLIDKTLQRHEELMKINGDHMSHIRADLTEVKNILVKNADDTKTYRKTVDEHMARVEPVIRAYEDEKIAREVNEKKLGTVVKVATGVGAVGAIGSAFIYVIKKFI